MKRIYAFFYFRCSGKKEIAEDLTSEVFIKALNAFESYDPAVSESAWIYMIAKNHFINYLEKKKYDVRLEDVAMILPDETHSAESIAQKFDSGRLMDAIQKLSVEDRELVKLKFLEGWAYDDIAILQKKTAGSLRVQAHRALKELKILLKQK